MPAAFAEKRETAGPAHLLALGAIVVVAVLIRLRYMGEPMRFDEAYTFYVYAITRVGHIISAPGGTNNHILNSLLVHASWRVFGDHLWVVRLPAFLAGVAIVPASYAVARALYGRGAALCAAALTATFAPLVDFSVNGRGYTLGVLFLLLALWLVTRLLERPGVWISVGVIASFALAFLAVPTMAYGIATVAIWAVASALLHTPRRTRVVITVAIGAALVGGLAALIYSSHESSRIANTIAAHRSYVSAIASHVWGNWNRAAPHPLDYLVLLGFAVSLAVHRAIARHAVPVAAAAAVALAGIVVFLPISPLVRSWLYLLPLYLIAAGAGLNWLACRAVPHARSRDAVAVIAAACVAIAFGVTMLSAGMRTAEARPASDNDLVALLHRYVKPGQHALIDVHVRVPAIYYIRRQGGGALTGTAVGPAEVGAGHVVVVIPRFVTARPVSPVSDVRAAGGRPRGRPRLLVRRDWIEMWDVPLARR